MHCSCFSNKAPAPAILGGGGTKAVDVAWGLGLQSRRQWCPAARVLEQSRFNHRSSPQELLTLRVARFIFSVFIVRLKRLEKKAGITNPSCSPFHLLCLHSASEATGKEGHLSTLGAKNLDVRLLLRGSFITD